MAHTDDEERLVARQTQEELEAEQDGRISRARRELHLRLTNAARELDGAVQALNQLESNALFDAEYEGGGLFSDHLHEARRVLVLATALIPTDACGDYREDRQAADVIHALMQGSHLRK